MALDGKVLSRALDRYEDARRHREEETRRLRRKIYSLDPAIEELDARLRATVALAAANALSGGGDPVKAVEAIQEQNLALQEQRARRIAELGYPRDCIDDLPLCPHCGDRGFAGTRPCSCLMVFYAQEQKKELSRLLDLQGESFENFRLDYYDRQPDAVTGISPRQHMQMVQLACRRYAETFANIGENLLLSGAPGLGKTFLSACIASVVSDRGYVGTKPCSCLMRYYAQEQKKELSRLLDLQGESFESFRLDYYDQRPDGETGISPRQHMQMVQLACRRYAETFANTGENLLLSGAPGLGKTFLSACIASVVSDRGSSVVYDTALNVCARFEEARFGRRGDMDAAEGDVRRYLNCDLLILDDLGTELTTAYTVSVFYELINSRMRSRKSTVISTNLSLEEISRRYSPQIASRLEGVYENLKFYGQDIRLLKKAEG